METRTGNRYCGNTNSQPTKNVFSNNTETNKEQGIESYMPRQSTSDNEGNANTQSIKLSYCELLLSLAD